jgi:hypothetical protein
MLFSAIYLAIVGFGPFASSSHGATLDFDDGAAFALVDVLVDVGDVLGSVFVSEPQPDSTTASAAATAAVPVMAVRFTNRLLLVLCSPVAVTGKRIRWVCRSEA